MIREEKVKQMTKLAAFDQKEDKPCRPMEEYFRSDYLGKEMLVSFVTGTISFVLCALLWILYNCETLLEEMYSLDYMSMGMKFAKYYIAFMVVYLAFTYILYSRRYARGDKKIRSYLRRLRWVDKTFNHREE